MKDVAKNKTIYFLKKIIQRHNFYKIKKELKKQIIFIAIKHFIITFAPQILQTYSKITSRISSVGRATHS